ncbi:hypothetical protein FA13DRAFT_1725592 [Coprinellus micaceus]|uniref:Uncharacterized protein n=1 Tax=Coprinellus micaceus TaxID=71717 RepID=A0A4Y7TUW0_COPMI|nr:hypothetical protein FA13DRAFT_1725592 [Coprinellus micaceus]
MASPKGITTGTPTNREKSSFREILSRVPLLKGNGKLAGHPDARDLTKRGWRAFLRPFARKMTPIADVGASIAEAVPVLGAPLKGSLDALTKTLKIIEQRFQNHEGIEGLLQKLQDVRAHMEMFRGSERAEWLHWRLECVERDLNTLMGANILDHGHVSTAISQCEKDVAFFLGQFAAIGHAETQALLHSKHERTIAELEAVKAELAYHREHGAIINTKLALIFETLQIPGKRRDLVSITIIDPFGIEQRITQIPHTLAVGPQWEHI